MDFSKIDLKREDDDSSLSSGSSDTSLTNDSLSSTFYEWSSEMFSKSIHEHDNLSKGDSFTQKLWCQQRNAIIFDQTHDVAKSKLFSFG